MGVALDVYRILNLAIGISREYLNLIVNVFQQALSRVLNRSWRGDCSKALLVGGVQMGKVIGPPSAAREHNVAGLFLKKGEVEA